MHRHLSLICVGVIRGNVVNRDKDLLGLLVR
jgi:hypothetical protein